MYHKLMNETWGKVNPIILGVFVIVKSIKYMNSETITQLFNLLPVTLSINYAFLLQIPEISREPLQVSINYLFVR